MIGNWLNNFSGNWFGYWFGPKEPEFLCNPSILIIHETYNAKIVEELTIAWNDDTFQISADECPTL